MSTEKKYLKSSWGIGAVLLTLFCACASGQQHSENEKWLADERAALNTTVLLNNQSLQVPLVAIENAKIALLDFGCVYGPVFDSIAAKYAPVTRISATAYLASGSLAPLVDDLKFFNTLLITLPEKAVGDPRVVAFLLEEEKKKTVLTTVFGSGAVLPALGQLTSPLLWSSSVTAASASVAAQSLFGGIGLQSRLTQDFGSHYRAGQGFSTAQTRLQYTVPEEAGINSDDLLPIDAIAAEAIREKATPGAVVMVVKDGKVIFNKAYGSHEYNRAVPDKVSDIFDLASVTKVTATTLAVMRLSETGKLALDTTLDTYLARTRGTNRQDIRVKEVMLHQAGFVPYIPFYQNLKPADFNRDSSAFYPTKVADHYFLRKNYYQDVMWPQMLSSRLETRGKYVYSDLSMYYMKEIVEGITNEPLDQYVLRQFYVPLGMQTAGYNPRNRFPRDQIVPTEDDTYFRKTLLQGYVHDQGAAMVGGVAGHAGNFASTNDLAILFQMMLNKGSYGGRQYFQPATIEQFTARQSEVSRRGLGFDRWDPETSKHYPSELASPQTYGHTGYTGTCVWVDPAYGLIYIFLSNRVNPQVTDKLLHLSIRPRIQDVVYKAVMRASSLK